MEHFKKHYFLLSSREQEEIVKTNKQNNFELNQCFFVPILSDQQNFNVSVENMLTRCLDNERSWRLHHSLGDNEGTQLLIEDSLPLVLEKKDDTLVFPCILSALRWITQGRDSVVADPAKTVLPVKPSIMAKAAPLCDAAEIHVLITGSLHLVGGALKHLDPASSK